MRAGPNRDAVANEDWLRARSWDIRSPDGQLTTTLAATAAALGQSDQRKLAVDLLTEPFGRAAPAGLLAEARALLGAPPIAGANIGPGAGPGGGGR